ncbi:MAG: type II secretion system F family protein [Jatrophihabitans sp.]
MIAGLVLAGAGLLLWPAINPIGGRLRWLAAARLGRPVATPTSWWQRLPIARSHGRAVMLLAALFGGLLGALAGPVPAGLGAVVGWTVARCRQLLAVEAGLDRDRTALMAAVGALAGEYAAGATVGVAFGNCAPAGGSFETALAEAWTLVDHGDEPAQALTGAAALAPLALACALVGRTGASLAELLQGVRADLTADQATRRAVAAAVAGPRASAMLLAGLPVVGLLMGAAMGADPARVLLHSLSGLAALSVGVLLDLAGLRWTLALTRQPA